MTTILDILTFFKVKMSKRSILTAILNVYFGGILLEHHVSPHILIQHMLKYKICSGESTRLLSEMSRVQIYSHFSQVLPVQECVMAQLVSVSASNANSKIQSLNPAGNKKFLL